MPIRAGILMLFAALCLALGACNHGSPQPDNEPFIAAYRAGQYDQAYQQAQTRASGTSGLAHDRAALMAGLSAYALRRPAEAEKWLAPLLENKDNEVSGVAGWTLAMIAADRGNFVRAANLASTAAPKLTGDDAARAHLVAGDALARTGRSADAREHFTLALQDSKEASLRASIEARLARNPIGAGSIPSSPSLATPALAPTGRFVIQLGAFADRAKAHQSATQSRSATTRAGQAAAQVVTTTDPKTGSPLFAVQVGPFADRPTAESVLRRMAVPGTVMMAHP